MRDLTTTAVRAWFSGLGDQHPTRNGHAYSILNMICNTAVSDGLLERNPCQVAGAMNPKAKKQVKIAEVNCDGREKVSFSHGVSVVPTRNEVQSTTDYRYVTGESR